MLLRPSKSWGSGRQEVFLQLQVRIPALEHCPKFLVQGFDSRLQQQMRLPLGPLHLLLLAETLADDLVDGRLIKTGAYRLFLPNPRKCKISSNALLAPPAEPCSSTPDR